MNRRRTLIAGLACLALALVCSPAAATTASSPSTVKANARPAPTTNSTTGTGGAIVLSLIQISPTAVDFTHQLVITGNARNNTSQPLKGSQIRLRLQPDVLTDRDAVDTWLADGELSSYDPTAPGTANLATIAPGTSRRFTLTVPAGRLGLWPGSGFGPRAIALQALGPAHDVLGELRSTIVWSPGEQISRTRLSLLVPITESAASNQAGAPTPAVASSLLPSGRLQKLLTATSDPAISWAVDPAVLAAAQRMVVNGVSPSTAVDSSDDPTAPSSPSASPSSTADEAGANDPRKLAAGNWLAEFKAGRADRSVLGLPFADPDLTSLLATKKSLSLLRHSDQLASQTTLSVLGSPLDTTVAWPVEGQVRPAAIAALSRTGRTSIVLASGSQRPDPQIDYTPSGRSTIHTGAGRTVTGLLYDQELSDLLTSVGQGDQSALDTQTLLAQLAAITVERPEDTRQVLAVAPRTWTPDPAGVQAMMAALHAAPWVSLRDISSLKKAQAPHRAAPVYRKSAASAQLPIGQITSALAMSRDLDTFEPALITPGPVIEPLREQVASLLSVSWRSNHQQMSDQRRQVALTVNNLVGGVRLLVGGRLITARTTPIPFTVANDTDYPVRVLVRLRPRSGQLTIDHLVAVTAPARSQKLVTIPARAVGSGNVVVEGALLSTSGSVISLSPDFVVKVRPNWEPIGLTGSAIVLGFLLVVGLIRSLSRHRRPRVPLESVPDVDELATRRADEAAAAATPVSGIPASCAATSAGDSAAVPSAASSTTPVS